MTYLITGAVVVLLVIAGLVADGWLAFGKHAVGERKLRVESANGWSNGKFRNELPLKNYMWRSIRDSIVSGRHKIPREDIQIFRNDGSIYRNPPASGLRVSWLGHSSLLLELDDVTLLIDPLWGKRVSPFSWIGPRRWYESPLALNDLPEIDAVLISHDHYDHLDRETIEALAVKVSTFIVPLGVGAHLAYWGIPNSSIIELEWWQQYDLGSIQVVSTPARHASGRHLLDLDKTLWSGFALLGSKRVYYSGDTGLFPGFKEIGDRLGPFDLSMIEVGAYSRNWPDWHLGPEQAVIANQWVKGQKLLPLHWGLFNLALHNWTEPMERILSASAEVNLTVVTPAPGQPFEPGITEYAKWWPDIPWQGPADHAVMSTQLESLAEHETDLITGR